MSEGSVKGHVFFSSVSPVDVGAFSEENLSHLKFPATCGKVETAS